MSQLTQTQRRIRVAVLPALFLAAIIVAAAAGYLVGSQMSHPAARVASPVTVTADAGAIPPGSDLNSEYLLDISRNWGPVPMTTQQANVVSELNSEYLLQASAAWFTPMTRDQARIRAELNSEYLREAALGW